jgi:hypothetical protein
LPLIFAEDLVGWSRWHHSQNRLRQLRDLTRTSGDKTSTYHLAIRGAKPALLFAVDATTPTAVAAFIEPLRHLTGVDVALLSRVPLHQQFAPGEDWAEFDLIAENDSIPLLPRELSGLSLVFSGGHYLPVGSVADSWANLLDVRHVVAQHGLLTPYAPPLPAGAHALSFSAQDSEFWTSGRRDVSAEVVGSQLLYRASKREDAKLISGIPVFLGQLHGAELPRSITGGTAAEFCLQTGASYRPHPAETDIQSRLQHRLWGLRGIEVDTTPMPLREIGRPVVSVFSTGVLEAAAAGIPSWVISNKPVAWVEEFWQRYNMSRWGSEPTAPPSVPNLEPAKAIAKSLKRLS